MYIAWLPSEKDIIIQIVLVELSKTKDTNPYSQSHLDYINQCLSSETDIGNSKLISHHSTLFFTKKSGGVVSEGDIIYACIKSIGWNETNVVLFVDFKRNKDDDVTMTDKFENNDLTHITFCCQKEKGGKAVNSRIVNQMIKFDNNVIISGTVHQLYKENSEKVIGGIKPESKMKVKAKSKDFKEPTPHQIFLKKLIESKNPPKETIGSYMKQFTLYFQNKVPTLPEIDIYVELLAI